MPRRFNRSPSPVQPLIQKEYNVENEQKQNTEYASEFNPDEIHNYTEYALGPHETELAGIERENQALEQHVQPPTPAQLQNNDIQEAQLSILREVLFALDRILNDRYKIRTFVDTTVPLSSAVEYELDYRERTYLFLYTPVALTIATSDGNSLTMTPNVWNNISFHRGLKLFLPAISASTPVYATIRASDELLSLPVTISSAGNNLGFVVIQNGLGNITPSNPLAVDAVASNNMAIAPGAATTVIKNAPGSLISIVVNAAGTTGFTIFDNAAAGAGNALYTSKAAPALGDVYLIDGFAKNGITITNTATGPSLMIYFN